MDRELLRQHFNALAKDPQAQAWAAVLLRATEQAFARRGLPVVRVGGYYVLDSWGSPILHHASALQDPDTGLTLLLGLVMHLHTDELRPGRVRITHHCGEYTLGCLDDGPAKFMAREFARRDDWVERQGDDTGRTEAELASDIWSWLELTATSDWTAEADAFAAEVCALIEH